MPGRLIAIEGIDGSGKGTQAKRLHERLLSEGRRVALLSFPRYAETHFGGFIGEYLNGRFGTLDEVHPFLASLLFAGDRFESRGRLEELLEAHDVVICDRYVASNVAHQGARVAADERDVFVDRIETIEYGVFGLPRADATILLDASVGTATALVAKKDRRSYTDRAADLHESRSDYLDAVRAAYLALASRSSSWTVVPCEQNGSLRSVEAIADDVYSAATAGRS